MPNGNINPYEYYSEFQNPYGTDQAYQDIGLTPSHEFLTTKDPKTGRTYGELIPGYDPYAEQEMATQFSQGAESAYKSSVGQLAGVGRQVREAQAKSGFAGGGAGQVQMESAGGELRKSYGQAFQGALLDLVGGIRKERMGYQEQLASLLESYSAQAPLGLNIFETGASGGSSELPGEPGAKRDLSELPPGTVFPDPETLPTPPAVTGNPSWNPPSNPSPGESYTFENVIYYFDPMTGWTSG